MDTPPSHESPALLLPSRFILQREIAEGGMARVSLVWDRDEGAWRALKTLKPDLATRAMHVERFEREGRALMQIVHPNIIRVFDMVYGAGTIHLVMEYAEGGSVVQWLERNIAMAPRLAVRVCLQLCSAVEAAHAAGFVHRDIKPHNLVIDRDGNVKLIDFGIARADDQKSHTRTGLGMGTVGYMAPEQHSSAKHVDVRADVYSIGVTLYTLLRGHAPAHLFMAEAADFEGVPPALIEVIARAGQYEPADRFATAREMGEALEELFPLLPLDPPNLPQLVPWDVNLVDELPAPTWTGTPLASERSIVPAPRRLPVTDASFPTRDELLSHHPRRGRAIRSGNVMESVWQLSIASMMLVVGLGVGLAGAAVVTERQLQLVATDLRVAEEQRAQSLGEHLRYLLTVLDTDSGVDPAQVDRVRGLLATLTPDRADQAVVDRTVRDDTMWLLIEALERLERTLETRSRVAAQRKVESAIRDLTRNSEAYEVARHRCETLEAAFPARTLAQVAGTMGATMGRCMGPQTNP